MKGFELIFMAPRSRRHEGKPVIDAIASLAQKRGITSMTRRVDAEGIGASGHMHSAHFFELTDEPEELIIVLDGDRADGFLKAIEEAGVHVFCMRRTIEYWQFGADRS